MQHYEQTSLTKVEKCKVKREDKEKSDKIKNKTALGWL